MIQQVEEANLDPFKITEIRSIADQALESEVSAAVEQERQDWLGRRKQDRIQKITVTYKRQPDWKKIREERLKKAEAESGRDVVQENALVLLNLGLLYLDFVDACRGGFSGRVEKCIQCFAVLFQGSVSKNYAGECMHMVACLKRIWKPQVRFVYL